MSTENRGFEAANRLLDASSTDRLRTIQLEFIQLKEQMEAKLAECCMIFGLDPDSQCNEADWAREICEHGTSPEFTEARILNLRGQL